MVASELQATSEHRDKLVELLAKLALANSSYSLDQLSLELDERLADRRFVAEHLSGPTGHPGGQSSPANPPDSSGSPASSSSEQVMQQSRHFALGAQLESDSALQWLASDFQSDSVAPIDANLFRTVQSGGGLTNPASASWPPQVCRLCKPQLITSSIVQEPQAETENSKTYNKSSALYPSPSSQVGASSDQGWQLPDSAVCSEFPERSRNWARPLVLTLQSSCVIIALALIGILFRCRKSRVSDRII